MDREVYYVLSFDSTSHAIQTEKLIKDVFDIVTIPTPREITQNCGLSIKVLTEDFNRVEEFVRELKVPCSLYGFRYNEAKQSGSTRMKRAEIFSVMKAGSPLI